MIPSKDRIMFNWPDMWPGVELEAEDQQQRLQTQMLKNRQIWVWGKNESECRKNEIECRLENQGQIWNIVAGEIVKNESGAGGYKK